MDLYTILGIERDATLNAIKRAYRRLARRYHPDINPGDREAARQFRQIMLAYETLSDPDRRRRYDLCGAEEGPHAEAAVAFDGFDFSVTVQGQQASTFGDLFAEMLRSAGRQPRAEGERGADVHTAVSLTFDEAMRGVEQPVAVTRSDACRACHGAGVHRVPEERCPRCEGLGVIRSARGHMVFSKSCPPCGGTGLRQQVVCGACGGDGVETCTDTFVIPLPAGVADRQIVRVPGKGHVGRRGGAAGDLYVKAQVAPHPLFRREGDDLHLVVPLAIHEAALGAKIDVPTIDGPTRMRIPPGTQAGQRFRLRERGAPSPVEGRRGDLIVEVRLVLPDVLDERSKELLREFGRVQGENVRKDLGV